MHDQENQLVVQHNALIEAHYKLEATEKKLILVIASMIKPDDKDFQDYVLTVRKVQDIFEVSGKNYYKLLRGHTKSILKKPLSIQQQNGDELFCNWFSSIKYVKGKGEIEFCFDPKLKPYLLDLQSHFTPYGLKYVLQLKGFYSIRLYELLKQYLNTNQRKRYFDLEDLKLKLGIEQKKYKKYAQLKLRVINPAIKELAVGSDIRVSYKEKKHVRRVIGLEFTIKKAWIVPEAILDLIPKDHRADRRIIVALDRNADRGETALKNIIAYVTSQKPTHSFCGYLCHCLDRGFGADYNPRQMKIFKEDPVIPVFPGLRLQIGDKQIMTVEEGNVLRFENGSMPEGIIRQNIKDGLFFPVGTDTPPSLPISP